MSTTQPQTDAAKRLLDMATSRDGMRWPMIELSPEFLAEQLVIIEAEARSVRDGGISEPRGRFAKRSDDPNEVRRLAVEALIDAHYETGGLDAAAELTWLENHDDAADALAHALLLKGEIVVSGLAALGAESVPEVDDADAKDEAVRRSLLYVLGLTNAENQRLNAMGGQRFIAALEQTGYTVTRIDR